MKRKYADRSDWKRVLEREYAQLYLETDNFKGYISLLKIGKVKEPLHVHRNTKIFFYKCPKSNFF